MNPFAHSSLTVACIAAVAATFLTAAPALAQNKGGGSTSATGVITVDQAKAEAGGVTANDTPGFPITISQSGSYRLTSNLVLPDANTSGIVITAPNVSLDMNGFAIVGPASCVATGTLPTVCSGTGSGDGIVINVPGANVRTAITLGNGTVRGVGRHGVANSVSYTGGIRVERMFLVNNGGNGASMYASAVIADSQLSYNGQHGVTGNSLVLQGNVIRSNGSYGVSVNVTSAGVNNTIQGNTIDSNNGMRNLGPNLCGQSLCQ
jgi:hypothetical protein